MNRNLLFTSVLLIFCTVFFSAQKSYNTLIFEGNKDLKSTDFFFEEVFADSMDDFFANRPVDYTLGDKSITSEDLFD